MLNIIVILIAFILSYFAQKYNNRKILFCVFIWLSLCCGLRNEFIGNDTSNYITFFYDIKYFGVFYGSDIGFSILSYILMYMFNNPYILLLIYSLITNYFIIYRLWDFRNKASFSLMILIYSIIYYPYCFNIVRQFLAIALIFWATKYLEQKNYKKFMLINFIAVTFHTTAIIGLISLLIEEDFVKIINKYKKHFIIFLLIFSFLILIFFSSNIYKYLSYFLLINFNLHSMIIFKLFCVLMICFINYYQDKKIEPFYKNCIVQLRNNKIMLYYFIGLILSLSGMFYDYMNRIGFYFLMFEMPFWGIVIKHHKYKKIYIMLIVFILFFYVMTTFV